MKLHLSDLLFVFLGLIFKISVLQAQVPELLLPIGHSNIVTDASYSPDGKRVATVSDDRTVKIWNAVNGRLLLTIELGNIANTVDYSPDGKCVMTTVNDSTIKIWDTQNGKLLHSFSGYRAAYSPDGKTVATINDSICKPTIGEDVSKFRRLNADGYEIEYSADTVAVSYFALSVKIWDTDNGRLLHSLNGETNIAVYSPDCKYIVTSTLKNTLEIWDLQSFRLLHTLEGHWGEVLFSVFSPDGKIILSTSEDGTADMWDVQSGNLIHSLEGNEWDMPGAAFSPDGKNIITFAYFSDPYKVWDTESGKLLFSINQQTVNSPACYSPDGKKILIISADTSARVFDATRGRLLYSLVENGAEIFSVGFSPDGKNIITSSGDNTAKIWDSQNGKLKLVLTGHTTQVSRAFFTADSKNIWTRFSHVPYIGPFRSINSVAKKKDVVKIWDLLTGKILQSFEGPEWGSALYNEENKTLQTSLINGSGNTIIKTWNALNGKLMDTLVLQTDGISDYIVSPDNNSIVVINSDDIAMILDAKTGAELYKLDGPAYHAQYSPDGKNIVTTSWFGIVNIWDVASGRLVISLQDPVDKEYKNSYDKYLDSLAIVKTYEDSLSMGRNSLTTNNNYEIAVYNYQDAGRINQVGGFDFSSDGKSLIIGSIGILHFDTRIWDIQSGSIVKSFNGIHPALNPDGKSIVTFDTLVNIYDLESRKLLHILNDPMARYALFSPDGKNVIFLSFGGVAHDSVKIWDTQTGQLKRTIYFSGSECDEDWKNNRIMVYDNSKLVFFDMETGKELYSFIAIDSIDYLILTPDKYYMCSKNAANKLSWRVGNQLYSFDQFDLQYNRPDIVLERLGNPDTALIKIYRNAYEKRLRKSGFNENMFSSEWHTPEMKILNTDSLNNLTDKSTVQLKICGTDSRYKLNRLLISVNDVPIFGVNGLSLLEEKTDSIIKTINIDLSSGNNNIKVSCMNEKGVESFKESADIVYNPQKPVKPDLYIIGMSISEYMDKRFDLNYAAKDGKDIANMFKSLPISKKTYRHIIIDTLFNNKATRENFFSLKNKLLTSNVDDRVIVFVSGHGLLNKDMDFYFATYDIDFQEPEKRGISFDDLESILDSIPARKKLLMMDACHSGEVDKEEINDLLVSKTESTPDITFRANVREYNFKGVNIKTTQSGIGLNNSFELMQELFAGLDQGTGTTIISAAAGKGYALESPQWNNGVFTYSIINGLKNKAADKNKDGIITISELKDYSIKQVQLLTGGKQKPTARRESINYDWKIW